LGIFIVLGIGFFSARIRRSLDEGNATRRRQSFFSPASPEKTRAALQIARRARARLRFPGAVRN
jgi:hypothetical protein